LKKRNPKIKRVLLTNGWTTSKCKNKITNEMQMNMVNAITSLTNVMKEILKVCDKNKEPLFPKQNSNAHNKEDAQYVFSMYRIL